MDKNQIEFREFNSGDYEALEKIIKDTWNYDRFASPKLAKKLSRLYLATCLCCQDFTRVAVYQGESVGIIMGRDVKNHRVRAKYALRALFLGTGIMITREGRNKARRFSGINALNEKMLAECGRTFDAELEFFALRADTRGAGIGKSLYLAFADFMKSRKLKSFFLYTDSTCNVGFYDHLGLTQIAEGKFSPMPNNEMTFYVYEGPVGAQ